MNISVFGLGYVGCVSAACFAKLGHKVIGVDVNPEKVRLINEGKSTIIENEIGDIVRETVGSGQLSATESTEEAILASDISLICVGTPSNENGSLNLKYVESCATAIGEALAKRNGYHVVVNRSTMLPESMRNTVIPALEAGSGKVAGSDFGVCINPEFLREATSVRDFHNPPYTVIGALNQRSADFFAPVYDAIDAPVLKVPIEVAEMIKYASNSYHALKICFANEVGRLCKSAGVDSHLLMDIFCKDDKLNTSKAYLKPGFAFGGSCLPKDVRALSYYARSVDQEVPVLESLIPSNKVHLNEAIKMITRGGRRSVGMLGLAFKSGTDDLRESPLVSLVEYLIGRGFPVKIFDANVRISSLFGANRQFIESEIPHIDKLMVDDLGELVSFADILVVGQKSIDLHGFDLNGKEVIELDRMSEKPADAEVQGICW
ncbi:GDP-mannose dehydrogenase [candidate division LCP-89 bacterium B3_LCP]|uniref:UDP-glucose 6-dehydrogenase n=1 Tax=candidate division LCP-89 bacterium B3_LCP TaxID=2012998 RepID=A0A532V2X7_UNCL8|nr:MAG: GDP-mannose dehydrogenase [candidate division LCP-89 bacterium B3_LCP]